LAALIHQGFRGFSTSL